MKRFLLVFIAIICSIVCEAQTRPHVPDVITIADYSTLKALKPTLNGTWVQINKLASR
jgi:hypothetical protein